ncbi:unnamed protein product [Cuscuta epithymum]|uniref:F-box domain-containing protein n=1 Tax=Cuscuta epithymum TaxID=186058 RepID=A0AAV0F9J7_9ASTE|nr:unnamed protein product [Cuscuta epithymum]
MDEQIITRILLCLPPKSLFRFRVVSKSWNHLISDPFFVERYNSGRRGGRFWLLAFFRPPTEKKKRTKKNKEKRTYTLKMIPLDSPGNRNIEYQSQELEPEPGMFINSSNGLILWGNPQRHKYHVLNPFTKRSVSLPPLPTVLSGYADTTMALMCEENKRELTVKYIVVRTDYYKFGGIFGPEKHDVQIMTYSSETGVWAAVHPTLIADPEAYLPVVFKGTPLVMNGVFHWYYYRYDLTLALYRPGGEQVIEIHRYGGIENNGFKSTTLTRSSIDNGDVLWFGCIGTESMRVFMLPNGSEEWALMYDICGGSLGSKATLSTKGIILEGFLPIPNKAPVAIIRFQRKIFLYNIDTKSLQSVPGRLLTSLQLKLSGQAPGDAPDFPTVYPFWEPYSLSTFAL